MDVDAEHKQLTDLLRDFRPAERDAARERELLRQRPRQRNGRAQPVLKEAGLDALAQRVADGEFGHVVLLLAQGDEVVVDARLVLARVVEIEVFRLDVLPREGFARGEFRDVGEEAGLLRRGHTPDYHCAVVEEEDLGCVDAGVEVEGISFFWIVVVGFYMVGGRVGAVVGEGVGTGVKVNVAGRGRQIEELLAAVVGGFMDFNGAVGVAAFGGGVVDG